MNWEWSRIVTDIGNVGFILALKKEAVFSCSSQIFKCLLFLSICSTVYVPAFFQKSCLFLPKFIKTSNNDISRSTPILTLD